MCEPDQKTVAVEQSVGMVLSHDITEIDARTNFKGSRFRRGHVIREDDIPRLRDLGKEHIYVLELAEGQLHEDDAAVMLAEALAGENAWFMPEPREGRINIIAGVNGLLKVDAEALARFNSVGEVMCATRHTNTVVSAGDIIAGTRAIPLVVDGSLAAQAAAVARAAGGLVSVRPFSKARVALVITGTEVYTGRKPDAFEPVIRRKVEDFDSNIISVVKCPDSLPAIRQALVQARSRADLIVLTGGMSVDPDDLTPLAVREAGAEVAAYGAAALPGSMLMVAYFDDGTPVVGVPACGIHNPRTIFDLVLPRLLAGERLEAGDIATLGHGGLCLDCPECRFPVCPFGKSA